MRSVIYNSYGQLTFATRDEAITIEDVLPTVRVLAQSPELKGRLRSQLEELGVIDSHTYLQEDKFLNLVAQNALNGTLRLLTSRKIQPLAAVTPENLVSPSVQSVGSFQPLIVDSAPPSEAGSMTQAMVFRDAADEGVPFCEKCKKPLDSMSVASGTSTEKPPRSETPPAKLIRRTSTKEEDKGPYLCETCKMRRLGSGISTTVEDTAWAASYFDDTVDSIASALFLPIDSTVDTTKLIKNICELRNVQKEDHPIAIAANKLAEKAKEATEIIEKENLLFLNNLQETEKIRAKYYTKLMPSKVRKEAAFEAAFQLLEKKKKKLTNKKIGDTGKASFQVANDARMIIGTFVAAVGKCLGPLFAFVKCVIKIVEILRSEISVEHCQERQQSAQKLISSEYEPLQRLGRAEVEFWQTTLEAIQLDNGTRGILAVCAIAFGVASIVSGGVGAILAAIACFTASSTEWVDIVRELGGDTGLPSPLDRSQLYSDILGIIKNDRAMRALANYAELEPMVLEWAIAEEELWILLEDVPTLYYARFQRDKEKQAEEE